jgi:MFS family permease
MTATPSASSEDRGTYRRVLAEPVFRLLFATKTVTTAAASMRILALSTLVYATTRSPLWAAVAFAAGFLPQLAGSALFGAAADRVRPRPLLVAGYTIECVAAVVLAVVPMPAWAALVLVSAAACATPVFAGASSRLVAEVLPGDLYVVGRSLFTASSSAAQIGGLVAGGIAIAAFHDPRLALLAVAVVHGSAALLIRLRLPNLPTPDLAGVRPRSLLRSTWSGQRALLADPLVRRLLLVQWLPAGWATGAEGLLVPYAANRGFFAGGAGLLLGCLPLGMGVGDVVVSRAFPDPVRERLVAPLVGVIAVTLIGLWFGPPLPLAAMLLLLTGVGLAYPVGLQRRFLAALPPGRQGQAFGLLGAGLTASLGITPVLLGTAALAIGTPAAMAVAGMASLLCVWLVPRPANRRVRPGGAGGWRWRR